MPRWRKIGVIAGGGELPIALAEHFAATGQPYWIARVAGFADPALAAHPGGETNIGELGARLAALKAAGCDAITPVGIIPRPDFASVRFDAHGAVLLPHLIEAARKGDDALLRVLIEDFEREGFIVVGAHEALADLAASAGVLGAHAPNAAHLRDIEKAAGVAAALGAWDIGQAVVVCDGLVLAVEAQEGTDALLARVAGLSPAIRGAPGDPRGVLVKRPKPMQERRIDLPTIGVRTIEAAAAAGLAGVAVEAGGALVLHRAKLVERADALSLFVFGFTPKDER